MIRVALLVGLCLAAGMGFLRSRGTSLAVPGDDPWCPARQPKVTDCTAQTCISFFEGPTPSQKGNCLANTMCSWQYKLTIRTTNCYAGLDKVKFRGEEIPINAPDDIVFTGNIGVPCEQEGKKVIRFYNNGVQVGTCLARFPCDYCPDP